MKQDPGWGSASVPRGTLCSQRPDPHPQLDPSPVPREPVLSSIDESNPIYYNKLHLLLPIPLPPRNSPHSPILLWQCHILSVASCPSTGLGQRAAEGGGTATPGRYLL